MNRNETATVSVHLVEHHLLEHITIETRINIFAAWLIVCNQVVKNTAGLHDVDFPMSILFVLVKVWDYGLLKMSKCLLECLSFLLFDFTHEVIEFQRLLVVDTDNLVRSCLKQTLDAR